MTIGTSQSLKGSNQYRIHRRVFGESLGWYDLLCERYYWSVYSVRDVLNTLTELYYEVEEIYEEELDQTQQR